jgi:hypothetical protein
MSNSSFNDDLQILMKALKFDFQDLEANRVGFLSENQAHRLKRRAQSFIGLLWFFAITIIALLLPNLRSNNIGLLCIPLLMVFIFSGIVTTIYLPDAVSHSHQKRFIRSLRGRLRRHRYYWSGRPAGWRYKVRLLHEEFSVEKEVYKSFIEGACYIIYYEPRFKQLLSAEPTSSGRRVGGMTLIGFRQPRKKGDLYIYL